MKRAKKLVTILTIASLTLGSVATVFGDTTTTTKPTTTTEATTEKDAAKPEVVVAATVVTTVEKTYPDLAYTEKYYHNDKNLDLGVYPVVTGMDALNKDIENTIYKSYTNFAKDFSNATSANTYKISYKVTNTNQYAKIDLSLAFNASTINPYPHTDVVSFYIDKAEMKVIDAEVYNKVAGDATADATAKEEATTTETAKIEADAKATVEAKTEEAATEAEAVMVPLRKYAETLGFDLKWDEATKSVTITKDDEAVTTITVNKNAYTVNNEVVELDAAPVFQGGTVLVPVTFFTEVLGAKATVDAKGVVTLVIPEAAADTTTATK